MNLLLIFLWVKCDAQTGFRVYFFINTHGDYLYSGAICQQAEIYYHPLPSAEKD